MKVLQTHNMLNGAAVFKVPAGQWGGFVLRGVGDAAAGVTILPAHFGNITATFRGDAFMATSFAQMHILDEHIGGVPEAATAVGAAFAYSVFIPASYVGDGNVFDVVDTDNMYITVDLNGMAAATIDSGTLTLLGVPQLGACAYLPHVISQVTNVPLGGNQRYDINRDNVGFVMLATLTNLAQFQITRDRQTEYQCSAAEGLAQSNWYGRIEVARTDDILCNMMRSSLFDESLSDDVSVYVYATGGGAAAVVITAICCDPTPDLLARSKDAARSYVNSLVARKQGAGKTRAVTVHNELVGSNK